MWPFSLLGTVILFDVAMLKFTMARLVPNTLWELRYDRLEI